jgi:hypothetical protein
VEIVGIDRRFVGKAIQLRHPFRPDGRDPILILQDAFDEQER